MKAKIFRDLLILAAVFGAGWLGFTYLNFQPKGPDLSLSVEQEEKLGNLLTDKLFSDMEKIESKELDSAMKTITYRLKSALDSTPYEYTFHVVKNEQVNAFATLGGHIYVFSGLIEVTESPEELAAVIAHEMGHVEHRHVVDKMAREFGITLAISILSGGDPSILVELLDFSVSSVFSRHQEGQADDFGLALLEDAHIDPKSMANAFVRLKKEGENSWIPEFLQSHPNIDSRIAASMSYTVKDSFENHSFDMDWTKIKSTLP